MAFAVQPFNYWRCDIIYKFDIVCSTLHRGKIAVYYEPNLTQASLINADLSLNKQFLKVVDIQDTQTFEVCVGWASHRAWLRNVDAATAIDMANNTANITNSQGNGYIIVTPFTSLQSPDSSSITVNVHVRASDFHVNGLNGGTAPFFRSVIAQSGDTQAEYVITGSADVSCEPLNESTATVDKISDLHFGEEPFSFRSLLKRYVRTRFVSVPSNNTGASIGTFTSRILPPNNHTYGNTVNINTQDLFTYLQYAYMAWRGGIRKHIYPTNSMSFREQDHIHVTLDGMSSSPLSNATWSTALASSNGLLPSTFVEGSMQFIPRTNGGIEVELPFYSTNYWVFSFTTSGNTLTIGSDPDVMDNQGWYNYNVTYNNTGAYDAGFLVEDSAAAEDFTFLRYQGAPAYSAQ